MLASSCPSRAIVLCQSWLCRLGDVMVWHGLRSISISLGRSVLGLIVVLRR